MRFLIFIFACLFPFAVEAADLKVVASTAPLHSAVSFVMRGAGTPSLLVPPAVSVHDYVLKPSDMMKLARADVVFWNGKELEGFLPKALEASGASDKSVAVLPLEGMKLLQARSVRTNFADEGGEIDPHFWLMPENMAVAAAAVAETLAAKDPDRAELYRKNASEFKSRMNKLGFEIKQTFQGMKSGNFLFFHDAFLYFEHVAGVRSLGIVEAGGHTAAGAGHLSALREKIRRAGKVCLFTAPQFPSSRVTPLSEGLSVTIAEADPAGAGIKTGENFYTEMMHNLIQSLYGCLKEVQ